MLKQIRELGEIKSIDFDTIRNALYMGYSVDDTALSTRQQAIQGYLKNVIVYRCINEIVKAACDIEVVLKLNGEPVDQDGVDPVINLLKRPNTHATFKKFVRDFLTNYLYSGNAYVLAYDGVNGRRETKVPSKLPAQLYVLNSYEVEVKTPRNDPYQIERYEHKSDHSGVCYKYPVDALTGLSRIFHYHSYHPLYPNKGLSPLDPAAYSVDIHNEGSRWNLNLLKNSAAPSGIFSTDESLTDNTVSRLYEMIKRYFTGSKNSGKAIVLDSGLKFQQLGLSPKEMDFAESLDITARNIASAFGVPFALISPEGSTYNNQTDSRMSFYENTVIPLLASSLDELALWLSALSGGDYTFLINQDSISALEDKRQVKYDRMVDSVNAGILTVDEARNELGYEPLGGPASELRTGINNDVPPSDEEKQAIVKRLTLAYDNAKPA